MTFVVISMWKPIICTHMNSPLTTTYYKIYCLQPSSQIYPHQIHKIYLKVMNFEQAFSKLQYLLSEMGGNGSSWKQEWVKWFSHFCRNKRVEDNSKRVNDRISSLSASSWGYSQISSKAYNLFWTMLLLTGVCL